MSERAWRCAVLAAILFGILGLAGPAGAQPPTGALRGRVTDADGSRLPGAVARISGAGLPRGRTATANANGEFEVLGLPPGRYTVAITLEGFTGLRKEVRIEAGETTTEWASLQLAEVVEEIVVDSAAAPLIGETPTASAFRRSRADGSTSLALSLDGGPVDSLSLRLSGKLRRGLEPGFLSAGWTYDAATATASGPPLEGLRLRLDGPGGLELPDRLAFEAWLLGDRLVDGKVTVEERPAVDPSRVPYMGLPEVIVAGGEVLLTALPLPGVEIQASNDGWDHDMEFKLALARIARHYGVDPDGDSVSKGDSDGTIDIETVEHGLVGAVVPYGEISGPIRVAGLDGWGETIFVYDWAPLVAPPGLCVGGPSITGVSALNFAGQQLCVCGCFTDAEPLAGLQIGGRPLGKPSGVTPYVANFNSPADLEPGPYEVGWQASASGFGGPFQTEVIEILARINDEVIQKGGTTALEMEIVGTDRALPVALDNRSPRKIELRPANSIRTTSSGGPGRNHVPDLTVTGLQTGTYSIDWTVDAGTCPCAETLPDMAQAWRQALDRIVYESPRLLVAGEGPGGVAPGPACGRGLKLTDDRFQVEIDWGEPGGGGSCQLAFPNAGLFAAPGSTDWEVLIKVIDGCAFNDSYWVFYAGTTSVELDIRVTDTASGGVKTYTSPEFDAWPAITDTQAFATCP